MTYSHPSLMEEMSNEAITKKVHDSLRQMNAKNAREPDRIHPAIAKALVEILRRPFSQVLYRQLDEGRLSAERLRPTVVPVHEDEEGSNCDSHGQWDLTSIVIKPLKGYT